ncbi:IS701 family transposase [Streptomyces avermitilis]|uniref:IS701 family transposase n=1 Tax=Streptomyces avermitilis TaxID=33903 RepID=UPI00371AD979
MDLDLARWVRDLMLGLLSDLPRKNCWSIAEWAPEATPDGMQHLLGRARWDADAVRDDVREYALEHLHDEGAVLVVDETGDVKKGTHTVGVQRQYTGTAGRIENAQVAVYLVYAGLRGHAAVDRELYTPHPWTRDPDRCRAAGLDEDTVFETKPEPAARMIGRFLDAGHRAGWVAADAVYGGNPKLCSALEERSIQSITRPSFTVVAFCWIMPPHWPQIWHARNQKRRTRHHGPRQQHASLGGP